MLASSVGNHGKCGRIRAALVRTAALVSMRWAAHSKLRNGPMASSGRRCKPSGRRVFAFGATGVIPTLNHCQNDCGTLMTSYAAIQSTRCASRANVRTWPSPTLGRRAEHGSSARVLQTSIFSAISIASSISMPKYRTVLSIFVCSSKSWTARRLPVRR
jgi:hypothetical protein